MADQTLWGIHAGRTGEANFLFRKNRTIALRWSRVSPLLFIKVQVKSSEGNIGDSAVSPLYDNKYGLFVTLGASTAQTRSFDRSKSDLRLIDGEELVDLIFRYYERFDSRRRALLPLKRVWVPEPPEAAA